jgi:hypothetical protein
MRHVSRFGRRRGLALATTLFAIVVIGTIISAALFASTQEQRSATSQLYVERALAAAEYAQNAVLIDWDRERTWRMPNGDTLLRTYSVAGGAVATAVVTKLNRTTFLVASEGSAGPTEQSRARRRTSMVLTLDIPQLRVPAAFTARGADTVAGSSITNGTDVNPTGWDCPAAGPTAAGIATGDSVMTYQGTKFAVNGNPPVDRDAAANDTSTYFNLGGTTYSDMATLAAEPGQGIVFTPLLGTTLALTGINPVVLGSTCVLGSTNWGDPLRAAPPSPCESYMPIIHIKGNASITGGGGGRGQGILLVDGNLAIAGNFEFHGLVIVRGRVSFSGTGTKVFGAVLAANTGGSANLISGNVQLQFSRCALTTLLARRAYPKPTKERAWADMF